MRCMTFMAPTSAHGYRRVRRQLTLLFAGALMLGGLTPITAAAASTGQLLAKDASVVEGGTASVRIVLAQPQDHAVRVRYRTTDGSAKQGADYLATSGRVFFPAGMKVARVTVATVDNTRNEGTEHFHVRLFAPVGASIADASAQVTIRDNDAMPTVSVADAGAVEPNSGSTLMRFPVTLSTASGRRTSVSYTVSPGSATEGTDYSVSPVKGDLVFRAGVTTRYIDVEVLGDAQQEPHETLYATLSSPVHLRVTDGSAVGTIYDTDEPDLAVSNATVQEGDTAVFEVTLSKAGTSTVTFDYATSDGTAKSPGDYTRSTATETIPAGDTSTRIKVPTTEDAVTEGTETFNLTISNVKEAALVDGPAKGTIVDDDPVPSMSVADTSAVEGNDEVFTVTLSKVSDQDVRVEWATADGTAKSPGDYVGNHGVVSIPAGHHTGTFSVKTVDDKVDEANQTFTVRLSGAHNATIGTETATATIIDNDGPSVSIGDAHATEGQDIVFPVTLSHTSTQDIHVDYQTANGTAKAPGDYTTASGTVTIPAGHLMEQITVKTADDAVDEPDETFKVELSTPVHATIGDGTAEGMIVDNDAAAPTVAIVGTVDVTEGWHASLDVTLSGPSEKTVTVTWSTADDSAKAPHDYTAVSNGTLTFAPGETTKSAVVETLTGDGPEPDEWFFVNLTDATNATLSPHTQGIVKIGANDS